MPRAGLINRSKTQGVFIRSVIVALHDDSLAAPLTNFVFMNNDALDPVNHERTVLIAAHLDRKHLAEQRQKRPRIFQSLPMKISNKTLSAGSRRDSRPTAERLVRAA